MDRFIRQLRQDFHGFSFTPGDNFYWRAGKACVVYNKNSASQSDYWLLLHELSHGLLEHATFTSDFGLLRQEVEAWTRAKELAARYKLKIADEFAEDCLDTYRDWLYMRSSCPRCSNTSLQIDDEPTYRCHNCSCTWRVSRARFCRPYRQSAGIERPILV